MHALITRNYDKGRDWYDFVQYVENNITPNYKLLKSSMIQDDIEFENSIINKEWIVKNLKGKAQAADWSKILNDITRFISLKEYKTYKEKGKEIIFTAIDKFYLGS